MAIGEILVVAGLLVGLTTVKRPKWLGGPERRYTADDDSNAMMKRASRQSLGAYLVFAGVVFWLLGV